MGPNNTRKYWLVTIPIGNFKQKARKIELEDENFFSIHNKMDKKKMIENWKTAEQNHQEL